MNYRPPEWKNPYIDHWGKEMTLAEDYETNQHYSFEAGADAILMALEEHSFYIVGYKAIPFISKKALEKVIGYKEGRLVFIEEK